MSESSEECPVTGPIIKSPRDTNDTFCRKQIISRTSRHSEIGRCLSERLLGRRRLFTRVEIVVFFRFVN